MMFWLAAFLVTILAPVSLFLLLHLFFPKTQRARPMEVVLGHVTMLAVLLCWLGLALFYAYLNVPL